MDIWHRGNRELFLNFVPPLYINFRTSDFTKAGMATEGFRVKHIIGKSRLIPLYPVTSTENVITVKPSVVTQGLLKLINSQN